MVLGKREISLILLVFGVVISVYMALLADSTSAQGGGTTGGLITSQSDEGCDNPEVVDTFSGTENQRTPQFEITGNTFRLSYDVTEIIPDEFTSFSIDVLDEDGLRVDGTTLFFDDVSDSTNILEGPGTFSLEIDAENAEFTVTVEDCVGTEPTTLQSATPRQSQNEPTIINVPRKPLPPTGGGLPVYGMVAGSILAGVGLLGLGIGIRRG